LTAGPFPFVFSAAFTDLSAFFGISSSLLPKSESKDFLPDRQCTRNGPFIFNLQSLFTRFDPESQLPR
jgi:hypothetical protein